MVYFNLSSTFQMIEGKTLMEVDHNQCRDQRIMTAAFYIVTHLVFESISQSTLTFMHLAYFVNSTINFPVSRPAWICSDCWAGCKNSVTSSD